MSCTFASQIEFPREEIENIMNHMTLLYSIVVFSSRQPFWEWLYIYSDKLVKLTDYDLFTYEKVEVPIVTK